MGKVIINEPKDVRRRKLLSILRRIDRIMDLRMSQKRRADLIGISVAEAEYLVGRL